MKRLIRIGLFLSVLAGFGFGAVSAQTTNLQQNSGGLQQQGSGLQNSESTQSNTNTDPGTADPVELNQKGVGVNQLNVVGAKPSTPQQAEKSQAGKFWFLAILAVVALAASVLLFRKSRKISQPEEIDVDALFEDDEEVELGVETPEPQPEPEPEPEIESPTTETNSANAETPAIRPRKKKKKKSRKKR